MLADLNLVPLPATASTEERNNALAEAYSDAMDLTDQAIVLAESGNHLGAIDLNVQALRMRVAYHGLHARETAVSLNELSQNYIALSRWDEAEEALNRARVIREGPRQGGFDAAVTRENLGKVYEGKGDWAKARLVRAEGKDEVACSNHECYGTPTFPYASLKRCSACRAPVYCSVPCQKADWTARHKVLCRGRAAAVAKQSQTASGV